jgi:DNA-binding Xre family transcriptional regulator
MCYIHVIITLFIYLHMLSLNLPPILKARGIERPYSFLVKAGFTPHTANNILHGQNSVFNMRHIELLCKSLLCEPHDLLLYTPCDDEVLPQNHPLHNLMQSDSLKDIKETLATLPFKQLKEITKQINGI